MGHWISMEAKPFPLPGQHEYHGHPFPLALELKTESLEAARQWITENSDQLGHEKQLKIA